MSYESPGARASDFATCQYGASRLPVRGPRRDLDGSYAAFIGGSETFGQFVAAPFPELVERDLGRPCVNLGCVNAGVDAFVHDPDVMSVGRGAAVSVIQLFGAQNLSNRFYRVHPRRNDRFLAASALLTAIYRDIDFTDFSFNRHLLGTLRAVSEDRFAVVREELETAWLARMRLLLRNLGGKALLLWLRYVSGPGGQLGPEPLFVTRAMVDALRDEADVLELPVTPAARAGDIRGMSYGPLQAAAAENLIGPDTHRAIAQKLAPVLETLP